MNLHKLKRMVVDGDMSTIALRYLIECRSECEYLDFKEELHLSSDYNQACFARDIVAMKNVGGGYIVVGVRDKIWEPIGLTEPLQQDTKQLRDIIRKTTGLELDIDIVKHTIPMMNSQKEFAIVLVRGSSKRSKLRAPSICKRSFKPQENWGIRDGDIYFRKGDETKRINAEELQELLLSLMEQEDNAEIEQQQVEPSPFMIEDGLYRILPPEYENFIEREELQKDLKNLVEGDPRIWIINVYGPGGVGKSTLASWLANYYYANRYDTNRIFDAILHLSAKDTKLSETGIRQLRPTLYSLENLIESIMYLFDFNELLNESFETKRDIVQTLLTDYKTLLILDNMETVQDGRIINFISNLPPSNKSKVLLTSRLRTSGWEKPLQVNELSISEVKNFLRVKAKEKNINLVLSEENIERTVKISGGLPLAIEWIIGQYALTGNLTSVLDQVPSPDSALLAFSFNTSWNVLSKSAQKALAVLSIFDEAPTIRLWATALELSTEFTENAAAQLIEATFISKRTDEKTGKNVFQALPITKAFARNKLKEMGDIELTAMIAYKRYLQQMELVAAEMQPFSHLFESFGVRRDTEKQAIILTRKAESQASDFNYVEAEKLYKDALGTDPRSIYVLVKYGLFKSSLNQIGEAIQLLENAARYADKNTGFFIYYNFSQIYDKVKDRIFVERYLEKALEYKRDHLVARHQLGVVKSRLGKYVEAIRIFDELIKDELCRESGPTDTLAYTYKTKVISLIKSGKREEAREVKEEAIKELSNWTFLAHKISEIENIE